MDITELHYQLKLECNKIDSNDRPDLLPAEIDTYLNRGIKLFLKSRYGSDQPKRGFETDQLRISQLANLHIKSPENQAGITPTSLGSGIYELKLSTPTLSNSYFVLTRVRADITKNSCTKQKARVYSVETDDRNELRFIKPDFDWGRINGYFGKSTSGTSQSLFLDTNNEFSITKVYPDYIKYPNTVFIGSYDRTPIGLGSSTTPVQCDLDEMYHSEIISLAKLEIERDLYQDPNLTIAKTTFEKQNN